MFRTTDIVLIAVMVSAAAFTYKTKHEAENQLAELRKVESQLRLEQETIDLLKADWSVLTQPARLQQLAEIYQEELKLAPVEPQQIATPAELPAPPVEMEASPSKPLGGMADTGADGVVTGSTTQ
ncbi:hypothetical protein FQ775_02405 [Nitratireductor mangrovi]|uniref:Cell division protein FtsL n=1 Tax=Nitratireductor mangrovi TaxID=2599600 RepID=A0A5B8KUN3_9HYPH|nr:hypothetical protein [Nitratireductor mangrovi]QDY99313.1 hypothetical protein FQ775_02405 [Nitratireductor mangrovi]